MSAEAQGQPRSRLRVSTLIKASVTLALLVMTIAAIVVHEAFLFQPEHPNWAHIRPFQWLLLAHVIPGAICFVIGPLQFSDTLRARNLALHRWLGRIYVVTALIAGALALYISVAFELPSGQWVLGAMAALWIMSTALAWIAIVSKNLFQHKLWMGRSYGFAFTFVTTRFFPDIVRPGMDYISVTTLYWVLIVIALIVPDLVLWNARRR